ncbi:MAG: hypothetical protein ISS66_11170 [Desulfobacteraceae bacterium]|nr:hypothetical protein [Desulfobacteraceae bacterium]
MKQKGGYGKKRYRWGLAPKINPLAGAACDEPFGSELRAELLSRVVTRPT